MDKMIISIHAPTRGATFCSQNQHHAGKISIHAPTRGATFLCGCRARREIISIHAPTRGATQSQVTQLNSDLHFNPRSHKGSDVIDPARTPRAYKISIHAPTRGATTFSGNVAVPTGISIHAPTRGATTMQLVSEEDIKKFQSTLPQGERHNNTGISIAADRFQSTLPQGERRVSSTKQRKLNGFQSTLPQGERRSPFHQLTLLMHISIHAPTRGATAILHKIPYLFYFIFTNPFPISYFHTQPASDF